MLKILNSLAKLRRLVSTLLYEFLEQSHLMNKLPDASNESLLI